MSDTFAHPEVLVTTQWVDDHKADLAGLRIVESDEDVLLYETNHIPGAVKIDWVNDLNDPVVRDYLDADRFAALCAAKGIANDTPVVFYGDKNNWWACYAFWVFKLFGHKDCRIMDGGRKKWEAEGRPMTRQKPVIAPAIYHAQPRNDQPLRAFRDQVLSHVRARRPLVDVRSPKEFTGEMLHMPDYPQEGALRGGHIPGARSVPWSRAAQDNGAFKPRLELEQIYLHEQGLKPDDDVIAYCRIGERSSHTWFVLTYLLGFTRVRNYDGSWTEWGNGVGLPVEKGAPATPAGAAR